MWFGTGTGLVRYDGTTVYRYDRAQSYAQTITDNRINAIIEDAKHRLWIGTAQGLFIYVPEKDSFVDVDSIPENLNYLNNRYVSALCSDPKGRIWIGTLGEGMTVYDPETSHFTYLATDASVDKDPPNHYVLSLLSLGDRIWVGTKGGLQLYDARTMKQLPLPVADVSLATKEITQISEDLHGDLWFTTMDREIIRLTHTGERYRIFKTSLKRGHLMEGTGNILTLAMDGEKGMWIAGENSGLNYLVAGTEEIIHYDAQEGNRRRLPTNSIRSVFIDDTGITWIGTYNRGVYMIDNKAKKFNSWQRTEFMAAGINGDNVRGLAEDKDGNIWIACDGGGLAILDPVSQKLRSREDINQQLKTRYLSSLLFDDGDHLWIGTWGRGVYHVDLKSGAVRNYKLESNGFGDNKVYCLYEDSRKTIWAGSVGSGLFYFDPETAAFRGLNEEVRPDYIKRSAYVTTILEDANRSLWVGTLYGLYHLRYERDHTYDVTLFQRGTRPGELSSYDIQTIYQDPEMTLWFGTGDRGLARLSGRSTFASITKKNGLISNTIRGILTDARGNMWVSSNGGLSRYTPGEDDPRNYTREDGLPSNEFNGNACLKASDGTFYFGSDHGLVAFHPDSIRINPTAPVVYLTDLKLNNQSVAIGTKGSPLDHHISLTSAVRLSYGQRSFGIDFVAINYGQSSGNRYCYKLDGFDDEWNCVGTGNRATYTNIDPGEYVFLVKASSSDGVPSEMPARLEITIAQAPWKTWWAYLSYALLISGAVFVALRMHVGRLKMKNQLDLERLAREKEHAFIESKTQFFTNISHEFRTPLSLIAMPLESLSQMADLPSTVQDKLATMRTSTDQMKRLVNELMDFSKLESARFKLYAQHGDILQSITEIVSVFHDLAAKRKIHLGIHAMVPSLVGWFDRDKLEKILVNLLSNAFKFTPDEGQINIFINVRQAPAGEDLVTHRCLELVIVDNGIGIPPEELPFIFDKFYQTRSSMRIANPGTGIGLSLTKGLVALHHGSVTVESTPHAETKFRILLPVDREAYHDDEICEAPGYANVSGETKRRPLDAKADGVAPDEEQDRDHAQILLVEDNDELRKYIAAELRQQFRVVEARDGEEGLETALEKSPDLIISDLLMPVKSGLDLCREIKSNIKTSHIPVILLTAKAMVEDQIEGISAGADVYITKPFSIRFLVTHVNQMIASRQKLYARFSHDVYLMPAKVASNEIDQAFLQKAIDYIVENMQDTQLGVDAIANLFNLSRMQVYRKIKALTGKSAVEFIRMVRVKQAVKLMNSHRYTLSEIAYETGFNSSSYFTRVFKEEYGKTPSEYLERA